MKDKKKNIQRAQRMMHIVWAIPALCVGFRWPSCGFAGPALARVARCWPALAIVGCRGDSLAFVGHRVPSFAFVG
jgi:hypothetical protein